jgi:hypothetical protein
MKKVIVAAVVALFGTVVCGAQSAKEYSVALIVQNHTSRGAEIPLKALQDAFTSGLARRGFRVVDIYNAIDENLNRTAHVGPTPRTSAHGLARGLEAQGTVTASVVEFLDTTIGNPVVAHEYWVRISCSLADAQTCATVPGCACMVTNASPQYTVAEVAANKLKYLGDLLYDAADKCAEELEKGAASASWTPATPAPRPLTLPREPLTISDVDEAVQTLIKNMRTDRSFIANYDDAQREIGRRPIVIVGGLVDCTRGKSPTGDIEDLLAAGSQGTRMALMDSSRLFDAKDDDMVSTITKRILQSGDSPLEDGELMKVLKSHGSPDFFVAGDMRYFVLDNGLKGSYRLHLALHSLRTGKLAWEGVKEVVKSRVK